MGMMALLVPRRTQSPWLLENYSEDLSLMFLVSILLVSRLDGLARKAQVTPWKDFSCSTQATPAESPHCLRERLDRPDCCFRISPSKPVLCIGRPISSRASPF